MHGGIWLVIELGRDITPTNIFTKFDKDSTKTAIKGHNSGVPGGDWLIIELGQDIMYTNIFTKFDKDLMKTL